jgi:DNA segregation ATPase FtsK/SpoIIIE, S-DNA-T family
MAGRYFKRRPKTKKEKTEERLAWGLDPETRRSILGVALIIAGLVFGLSVVGWAGALGGALSFFLKFIFGIVAYPIPILLLIIGGIILAPTAIEFRASAFLGIGLSAVSLAAIAHLLVGPEQALEVAKTGGGGGMVGFGLASIFRYVFDFWASLIILLGGFIISILVATNFSLRGVIQKIQAWWQERRSQRRERADQKKPAKIAGFSLFGKRKRIEPEKKKGEPPTLSQPLSKDKDWNFPPLTLLEDADTNPKAGDIKKNSRIIEETLNNFNIDVKATEVNVGPTVSQYTLKPATGVKLNQITARLNDLSLALAAHPIRIEAPIPGRSAVGIEIPNKIPAIVKLRKILGSKEFKSRKENLTVVLGRDVSGQVRFDNLATMPHLLIAGATGSGKSVCINSILTTFLCNNSLRDLRLILVDPKRVEFTPYNDSPHLLTPVITDSKKTVSALKWSISEMERRYDIFQKAGKRNLENYNSSVTKEERLPIIVIVIDELADLMALSGREVEAAIVRLTQMARATGIHLIVATQRPSVDVITGLIKANITNRIAFAVASQVDSRTILDQAGAEKLLGNGDMLYLSKESSQPTRIQGILMSDKEINKVTGWLKGQAPAKYNDEVTEFKGEIKDLPGGFTKQSQGEESGDDLLEEAAKVVVQYQKGSASLLQRTLSVGYVRAARILDELQTINVVGPTQEGRPREVLFSDEKALAELFNSKKTLESDNNDR